MSVFQLQSFPFQSINILIVWKTDIEALKTDNDNKIATNLSYFSRRHIFIFATIYNNLESLF